MIDFEDSPLDEPATERPHFISAADVSLYVHAGKAVFTLESQKTMKRFTFRVTCPIDEKTGKPDRSIMFVAALTGPDNTRDFSYFGNIRGTGRYDFGRKAKIGRDSASVLAFEWFYRHVVTQQNMPSTLKVYHEGKCGRCGRRLTVPSSIRSGIGPECAKLQADF